jgi:hypothetical protein
MTSDDLFWRKKWFDQNICAEILSGSMFIFRAINHAVYCRPQDCPSGSTPRHTGLAPIVRSLGGKLERTLAASFSFSPTASAASLCDFSMEILSPDTERLAHSVQGSDSLVLRNKRGLHLFFCKTGSSSLGAPFSFQLRDFTLEPYYPKPLGV